MAEGEPDSAMAPALGTSPTGGIAASESSYSSPKEIVAEVTRRAMEYIRSKTPGQGKAKTTGGGGLQGVLTFQTRDPLGMENPTPADFIMHAYVVRLWAPEEQFPGLCKIQCPGCKRTTGVSNRGWEQEARSIKCFDREELLLSRRYVCKKCPGGRGAGPLLGATPALNWAQLKYAPP